MLDRSGLVTGWVTASSGFNDNCRIRCVKRCVFILVAHESLTKRVGVMYYCTPISVPVKQSPNIIHGINNGHGVSERWVSWWRAISNIHVTYTCDSAPIAWFARAVHAEAKNNYLVSKVKTWWSLIYMAICSIISLHLASNTVIIHIQIQVSLLRHNAIYGEWLRWIV